MRVCSKDLAGTDFSDVATGRLEAVAPGAVLLREFLDPMNLSANALAKALKVPANRITGILHGTRNITADTALRLQAAFWMGVQSQYNLEQAEAELADKIAAEVHRLAA